ncbi:conserved hypothetical protein [Ricinus communis]|uniref:Uncharacterized protein n=1 Tax=Ricinus communis TaxID=3988 RepID=B9SP07_RICCO|nr:conserved hypothetical protein [Ricinus communis]
MDKLIANFWWSNDNHSREIYWISSRLISHPDSLMATVVKCIYYTHTPFLKAERGSNLSWASKEVEDEFGWHFSPSGFYSVEKAYQMSISSQAPAGPTRQSKDFWSSI